MEEPSTALDSIQNFLGCGDFLLLENPTLNGNADGNEIRGELPELNGHCLFRTSGTEGAPKFVALSREALLFSAAAVNRVFELGRRDLWTRVIPEFHVGGFGILARAYLAGAAVDAMEGKWDARGFCERVRVKSSTVCSLVPTQVFDLVKAELEAPPSLRVVMVGGGALDPDLGWRAVNLGWPLVETFGMTETGAMMAVRELGAEGFSAIEGWEVRESAEGGVLELRGEGLFSGYVRKGAGGRLLFEDARGAGGWFRTSDRVRMVGEDRFEFLGRASAEVKVLGEMVNLDRIQERVGRVSDAAGLRQEEMQVVAVSEERRGYNLVLADASGAGAGERVMEEVNRGMAGFEQICRVVEVEEIPRSALGKVKRGELAKMVESMKTQI